MTFLKKLVRKFEDEMAAAAVAQTGETEMAWQILKESVRDDYRDQPSQNKQEMMHLSIKPAEGK